MISRDREEVWLAGQLLTSETQFEAVVETLPVEEASSLWFEVRPRTAMNSVSIPPPCAVRYTFEPQPRHQQPKQQVLERVSRAHPALSLMHARWPPRNFNSLYQAFHSQPNNEAGDFNLYTGDCNVDTDLETAEGQESTKEQTLENPSRIADDAREDASVGNASLGNASMENASLENASLGKRRASTLTHSIPPRSRETGCMDEFVIRNSDGSYSRLCYNAQTDVCSVLSNHFKKQCVG
jgi:hypothetical protein